MLRDVRHQVEPDVQAVLHHDGLDEAEVGAGAGAERAADRIDRVGDLLGRPRRRALIEQRRRQRRDARADLSGSCAEPARTIRRRLTAGCS